MKPMRIPIADDVSIYIIE